MSDNNFPSMGMLKKQLGNQELPALREAGLIPVDMIDYLEDFRESYEPEDEPHYKEDRPAIFYFNAKRYVRHTRKAVGKTLSKAVQNGNYSVVEHAIGITNESETSTPFAEYLKLEEIVHGDDFKILVFTGGQGGGKSYLAFTIGNFVSNLCKRDGINSHTVTNSLSATELNPEMDLVESPQELLDYRLNHDGKIIWIMDEASSVFDSKAAGNAADLAKFVPFLRRLRKMDILPIIVSHRARDIGTDIRNLESVVFVDKPEENRAVFYEEEKNDTLEEKLFEIKGYTTDERYDYESNDMFISWRWDNLDEIVELINDSKEFRNVWEEKGVLRDLEKIRTEIDKINSKKEKREELVREIGELELVSNKEIAEKSGLDPAEVSRILSD